MNSRQANILIADNMLDMAIAYNRIQGQKFNQQQHNRKRGKRTPHFHHKHAYAFGKQAAEEQYLNDRRT
jgi:hypothetical protein